MCVGVWGLCLCVYVTLYVFVCACVCLSVSVYTVSVFLYVSVCMLLCLFGGRCVYVYGCICTMDFLYLGQISQGHIITESYGRCTLSFKKKLLSYFS